MLIGVASVKGSPGVTSTALVLAAAWPRPVVLVEADLSGGDLAYRCSAAHGGPVYSTKGLLKLAAAVRGGMPGPGAVVDQAQLLACGVDLVQGVTTAAQARGLAGLWPIITQACTAADVDVIADLGRLDRASALMPLAQAADCLVPVASTSLESVMHLTEGLSDVTGGLAQHGTVTVSPVLVGPDAQSARDCADLDELLTRAGLPILGTHPMPYDLKALERLEQGEKATGRLSRTLLLRAARAIASSMVPIEAVSA